MCLLFAHSTLAPYTGKIFLCIYLSVIYPKWLLELSTFYLHYQCGELELLVSGEDKSELTPLHSKKHPRIYH